jgi:predicted nucleic acid-binding Zn ribbon protein
LLRSAFGADILTNAMPTYVYKFVETGETIEIQQSFNDDTLTEAVHPASGAPMAVKKVFQPVGVTFKGDGFYKTDSRSKNGKSAGSTSPTNGDSSPSSSDKSSPDKSSSDKSSSDKSSGEKSSGEKPSGDKSSGERVSSVKSSVSTSSSSTSSD